MNVRFVRRLALGFALALVLLPAAQAQVRIGVAGPMSGSLARFGDEMWRGARLAVAQRGTGADVELVRADDACDPRRAVEAADELVRQRVAGVVGHWCSGASLQAVERYSSSDTAMVTPGSSNPRLTAQKRSNVFRVVSADPDQGGAIVNFLDGERARSIVVVDDGSIYGDGVASVVVRVAARRGITASRLNAPGGSVDANALRVALAARPGALVLSTFRADLALAVAREARQAAYAGLIVGVDALESDEFLKSPQLPATGVYLAGQPRVAYLRSLPGPDRFFRDYESRFGPAEQSAVYALYAHVATTAILVARERAGPGERLPAALRRGSIQTAVGDIDFDVDGDMEQRWVGVQRLETGGTLRTVFLFR